jgi:hypothetical protein
MRVKEMRWRSLVFIRTRSSNRGVVSIALAAPVLLIAACSGSSSPTSSAGGAKNLGGNTSSASTVTSGTTNNSSTAQGGSGGVNTSLLTSTTSQTGGTVATGGTASQGGSAPAGGSTATGGGTTNLTTGGKPQVGGASSSDHPSTSSSSGGTSSTGGTKSASSTTTHLTTGGQSQVGGSSTSSSSGGTKTSGGTANTGGTTSVTSGGPSSETELCSRWVADRADLSESGWTGSTSSCTAGDMSATSRANALRQVNLFRWIAALPPVTTSDQYNQGDQACAVMMDAQGDLSHSPDSSWKCYTSAGADAAGNSCIAGEGAVTAVIGYMVDPGNPTMLGHRRWILSNYLGPIGIGSTGKYSCMYTGTTGKLTNAWTAWPPPGYFPMQAAADSWSRSINTTGFSVQSDSINLANASVTITLNGTPLNVTVTQLLANYGSKYAISMVPSGWTIAAGNTYHVSVTGVSTAITYDVQVVSCG